MDSNRGDTMQPTSRPIATTTRGTSRYALYRTANGSLELWTRGKHGYCAGNVSDARNFSAAVDAAEEEMTILIADARAELGL